MHILKIKNQFNTVFIFIMVLALLSFFTANYFVSNVSNSYEGIIDNSLPVMRKSSEVAQLTAQIESHLIQLHFDAINDIDKKAIDNSRIEELIKSWEKVELLLDQIILSKVINKEKILKKKMAIQDYLHNMPQLLQQINLLLNAKKIEQQHLEDIEVVINYNNKILLVEMESFWEEKTKSTPTHEQLAELEYSFQFYKNSTQLLSYFRQAFLTSDIKTLNLLKRNSVTLFKKMYTAGSSSFEYKLFADTLLFKVKHIYAGQNSLFKIRYDVLRLENVTDALISQQIQTAKQIEEISDSILILIQNSLAQQKIKISNDVYRANQYLIFIIIGSFIISFFSIWFLVNKNLIKRITKLRSKILELSRGNTDIAIKMFNKDEIGDMEKALTELKGYVIKAKLLSKTDSLTGLLNHTQFKENLIIESRRHARQNQPLSLAIIDIDYFKNYNDYYGHPRGDVCLKKVSSLIAQTCKRAGEYAYRIGGEEFAILMPNTTAQQLHQKLKELQLALIHSNLEHKRSTVSKMVTISIGIYSCRPQKDTTADEYYQKADVALYQAKQYRNTIEVTECNG